MKTATKPAYGEVKEYLLDDRQKIIGTIHPAVVVEYPVPWDKDITDELTTNPGPYENKWLQIDGGWWQRGLEEIDAVTIHHTLSDSPHASAKWGTESKNIPTLQYTIWVTQTGEILKCVDLKQGLWHDHTGHENIHLSVGLAGRLHEYHPAQVQLEAAAEVCKWAIESPLMSVDGVESIAGHRDYIATQCPGWASEASGYWREDFYDVLKGIL